MSKKTQTLAGFATAATTELRDTIAFGLLTRTEVEFVDDAPPETLHLRINRIVDEGPFKARYAVDFYVSHNALRLIELADSVTPKKGIRAVFFIELTDRDLFHNQVFELRAEPGLSARDLLGELRFLEPLMTKTLCVDPPAYQTLVKIRLGERRTIEEGLGNIAMEALAQGYDLLGGLVTELVEEFEGLTAPDWLWREDARDVRTNARIQAAGADIAGYANRLHKFAMARDPAIDLTSWMDDPLIAKRADEAFRVVIGPVMAALLDKAVEIDDGRLKATFRSFFAAIRAVLEKIKSAYAHFIAIIKETAMFLKTNLPSGETVANAVVGYLCGLWDGVMDFLIGFADTASLVLSLAAAECRRQVDPRATNQLLVEGFDEFIRAAFRVNWLALVKYYYTVMWKDIFLFLKEQFHEIEDDPARGGYYLGYFAFNLAEFFYPPIKFTKVATVGRRMGDAANYIDRMIKL